MEIISYVLEGALEHKDSIGTGSVIRPGDVQRMTAGTGIRHSEFNASKTEPVHFLQIWIIPERKGLAPGYEQKAFSDDEKRGKLRLVGSRDGRDGSVTIHRDVRPLRDGSWRRRERAATQLRPAASAGCRSRAAPRRSTASSCVRATAPPSRPATASTSTGTSEAEVLLFDMAA